MADALATAPDLMAWRLRPRAPAPGTRLCALDEIPVGATKAFAFGGGKCVFSMFVVRTAGGVVGYLNLCPHSSLPLNVRGDGFFNETGTRIRCNAHFAEFEIESGFGVAGAAQDCWLDPVPLRVVDGDIVIGT